MFTQSDKKKKAGTGRRREEKSKGRPLDRRMMSDKRQTNMKVCVQRRASTHGTLRACWSSS